MASKPGGGGGKPQHSVITSALWAIARTPALVDAIEAVEKRDGGDTQLTAVLRSLGSRGVLTNRKTLAATSAQADALLAANRISLFEKMEPMDAIRSVVGLCGDSDEVFERVLETTYKTTLTCLSEGCQYRKDAGELRGETSLACTRSTAQLSIDVRATGTVKSRFCEACQRKSATEVWDVTCVVEVAVCASTREYARGLCIAL